MREDSFDDLSRTLAGSPPRRRAAWLMVTTVAVATLFSTHLGVVSAASKPAPAEVDLVCSGYSTTTYAPGLTDTPQEVNFTQEGIFGPCKSSSHPDIVTGSWKVTGTGTRSCDSVLVGGGSGDSTRTFRWNTGEFSVVERQPTTRARPGGQTVNVIEGEVIEGVFAGATTHEEVVRPNADLSACQTSEGLRSSGGPREIQFFRTT